MSTSTLSNFKIYEAQFQAGLWEGISQVVDVWNGVSKNAIRLVQRNLVGQYAKEAIFTQISDLVTRRNVTSTSAATPVGPAQDELISVKINRKIGPVQFTLDSLRKIGKDYQEMSFILGQQVGQAKAKDMLNTGILSVHAAIKQQSDLNFDATGLSTKTLKTEYLVSGLSKMGDAAERVVAWVMHSKPYFDLVKEQISANITNVADRAVYAGTPVTLNRPVILSDIPALWDDNASATDTYNVLGLVSDAVVVTESESEEMIAETVGGLENLVARVQGEFAYNLSCKGFKWDITNGGANPNDAALGTGTNWDKVMTSVKDLAGVRIKVQ